jgi:DNA-binding response OmpR family regulator
MAKILLVEDEEKIAKLLNQQLKIDKYLVSWINNGKEALSELKVEKFDLVILDLMLPGMSGEEVVKNFRIFDKSTPVIALTAKGRIEDIVVGLDDGFDDYLPKPFSYVELAARIRALLRRSTNGEVKLKTGDLELDIKKKKVYRSGVEVDLTNKEYQIIEYLMRRKGQYISQAELLEMIWDRNYDGLSNTLIVHMKNLKHKIDKNFGDKNFLISSERGRGYKIDDR